MSIESPDITDSDLLAASVSYVDIPDWLLEPEVANNEAEIHIIEGSSDVYVSVEQLDVFQGACLDTGAEIYLPVYGNPSHSQTNCVKGIQVWRSTHC